MPPAPLSRPTARVLLVDAAGRVLLLRTRMESQPGRTVWLTPGGGVRAGEPLAAAAARELAEETGHVLDPAAAGPVVALRSGTWMAGDQVYLATDSFFFARATSTAVHSGGQEELERALITGYRWWAAGDLDATADLVYPPGLGGLLRQLLAQGPPPVPVRLPWEPG